MGHCCAPRRHSQAPPRGYEPYIANQGPTRQRHFASSSGISAGSDDDRPIERIARESDDRHGILDPGDIQPVPSPLTHGSGVSHIGGALVATGPPAHWKFSNCLVSKSIH